LDQQVSATTRLRLVPVLCAVLAAGLALSATQAGAVGNERPTIEGTTVTDISAAGVTVEALIDPRGNETTYEIWLVCQHPTTAAVPICEEPTGGQHLQKGHVAASFLDRIVSARLTGLSGGYRYMYAVSAASTIGAAETQYQTFETAPPASCPDGCSSYIPPYESKQTPGGEAVLQKAAEEAAARQREYEREAKAQAEREAAAKAGQPSAPAPINPPITAPSSVSLASTGITVQGGHVSLIQLECLGAASCNGKLTLSAKIAAEAKSAKKHAHTVAIGTADFSISGDETETVKLDINATGRRLLSADHGRLSASLAILELPPSPQSTLTKAVRLIQQQTRVKKSK
jgi:hypothetical protein